MINVLIADDHAIVRSGLSFLIEAQEDMQVVGTAADGLEASYLVERLQPNVVLMDLSMPPGENGLSATKKIKKAFPHINILILTMHDDEEYLYHAFKSGATGYILKNAKDDELLNAIRSVKSGGRYIHSKVSTKMVREHIESPLQEPEFVDSYFLLSNREQEVLPLVALGYGNKEIADKLFISVKTVEAHKANMMSKLGLTTRPELVQYAIKKNLIDL
ncbi:response regulator transcription factor [Niallia taxi]|uniref:response regulator transcription factor n=1 Tax=Niallia taxi TaxID=2499688 RepID=UPI0028833D3E|nr:response regulator transcription factor [Niallia taxi]